MYVKNLTRTTQDSVDYIVHLGDYIYEYENGYYGWGDAIGRIPLPNKEIFSLYDYRKRHATYRTDLDLVASHQQFPFLATWDDHEVADNTYRDGAAVSLDTHAKRMRCTLTSHPRSSTIPKILS
jgi:alkaline phosphatase D